jgi:hypothetical protein
MRVKGFLAWRALHLKELLQNELEKSIWTLIALLLAVSRWRCDVPSLRREMHDGTLLWIKISPRKSFGKLSFDRR